MTSKFIHPLIVLTQYIRDQTAHFMQAGLDIEYRVKQTKDCELFVFRLSSLPVAHLSDALRRRLVVTGDSARIQYETTESSAWFFNVLGV